MTELVRFCPSCETERPPSEVLCEGTVGGAQCHWNLLEVPMTSAGWRPTPVVPVEAAAVRRPGTHCVNGHQMDDGDLICVTCNGDLATGPTQQEAVESGAPQESAETVIAGWRVLRQISSTLGLRDRFLVEESGADRRAVLTLYHHGSEPDPGVYEALRRVSREHVPEILATGRWNERAFEVAEEFAGGTLADLGIVASDPASVRRIVYELGKALDALGEVGLRHRDLRPGTLLVRNQDPLDLAIGGFGSARLSEFDLDIVSPLEITKYTAPEAIAGGVAAASDWWSLGMVLLEQITSGKCFEGINQQVFLIHVLANGVPLPSDLAPDLEVLLRGLLARDRQHRWKWKEVQAWLEGKAPAAPPAAVNRSQPQGPAILLGGEKYYTSESYALAAAEAALWSEACEQLIRGVVTTWAQDAGLPAPVLAGLRRISKQESLRDDWKLLLALKVLNPDMPPVLRGSVVTPKWLLENPLEAYELITGPVPDLLQELGSENWLQRLKNRADVVRVRAENLAIELDEDTLRINLLSTSRPRLAAEWDSRRKLLPDAEHHGLLNLLERRSLSEEDLIVVLSASLSQFRSCDAIVDEARQLASTHGVIQFSERAAGETVQWPRGEILQAVAERIEGFARCGSTVLNDWADRFRLEKRMQLAQALVLLSVPQDQWQEPQKQQYVSEILGFFEKKVVTSVMRGPLVRMTIGKTTPRVDLTELGTRRLESAGLLDHLLQRNARAITLDPAALERTDSSTGLRLQNLERHTQLYKRDTGIDGLYLAFPLLLTKDAKSSSTTRIAPVLLWPVRVHHEVGARGNATVSFDSDREEVRLNPALEALVGQETVKKWRKAAEELLGRSVLRAADVVDAFGTLATPRSRQLVPLPGPKTQVVARSTELECSAVLFHMTFMGQAIGEDIRQLKSLAPAGTGLETALRLKAGSPSTYEPGDRPSEIDRFFTVGSDPSQEASVLRARTAPGLLVEGPPGTGKSQTIVNMVGDAIGQKKSVLIICQKHAALEVVHKRLIAEGLGDRVVMVNDINRDRAPIVRAVREQLEELLRRGGDPASQVRRKREVTAARIESNEGALDRHHQALHQLHDRIGLSYRALLGELIKLESPEPPLDVPSLRPELESLNVSQLASLEEEVAPIVRYWLPARYEGSALAQLKPFAPDQATLTDFRESFASFSKRESLRHEVLTTRPSAFDFDDPAPHRAWLSAYGNEFLEMADSQRSQLVKWLPYFRGPKDSDLPGLKLIDELRRVRDALSACGESDHDAKLSALLTKVPTDKLVQLRALAAEAAAPVSFLGRINLFRFMRGRRVAQFLESVGDVGTTERMPALVAAAGLEQRWRPLRRTLSELLTKLLLPNIESDAGLTLRPTTSKTLSSLQQVAAYAAHLASAPWPDRLDKAALAGTRDALLKLYAEFDSAFARCEARMDSRHALSRLESWVEWAWVDACAQSIARNEGNGNRIQHIEAALPCLAAYQHFRGRVPRLSPLAREALSLLRAKEARLDAVPPLELEELVRRILNREARLGWKLTLEQAVPELGLDRRELGVKVNSLKTLDQEMRQLNRDLLKDDFDLASIRPLREWEDITRLTGQRARRLREFIDLGASLGLLKLRPVWLMNPDVASRVLPLKPALFNTVIYDEASQMPVEFALPSLFRGEISVVSGDEKQMPPTAFFSSKVESDEAQAFDGELPDEDATDEERDSFEETWNRREIKDCPDLLQLARTSLPNSRLQIHYRSAYRELINYSNAAFYGNDLSVPVRHPESVVRQDRPIEMVRVNGIYQDQTNPDEAQKVVEILAELWARPYSERLSVGVVTFNRKQADLIEEALELRAEEDGTFREAYRQESERNEDGEDMSVFVKNVENVQGDERDVIVFSSTFGRNKQGTFLRNFGVLGQKGGERRLNVAVTRSRKKIVMVTSMPIADISDVLVTRRPPSTPRDFLQGYMEYARVVSDGEFETARALLSRMTLSRDGQRGNHRERDEDAFYQAVGDFLKSFGHGIKATEEEDAFGLDFAIEHPDTGLFALGVECDAPRHPLLAHARAREVWRRQVLQRAIPIVHRVSCHGWYHDRDQERGRLIAAVNRALQLKEFA
jgi:primosomal replication protein N''